MRHLDTFLKVSFSKEFYITEKMVQPFAYIGSIGAVVFYFLCTYLGFWDSLHLRIMSVVMVIPLAFFPTSLKTYQKIYYEIAIFLVLPVLFTFLYLMNFGTVYWVVSFIWAGLIYGLASSKVYIAIVLFPAGFLSGYFLYSHYTVSTVRTIDEVLGTFAIAWFSVLILSIVKLVTNVFYLLSLDSESMRIMAEEAEKRKAVLENINAELKNRNMIISTFVRPSILNEVNMGKDPRVYEPRIVEKTILICDMRNFTPLTSTMDNAELQAKFINKYFEMMIQPVFEAGGEVDKLMGDAIMAVFPDGQSAVNAALKMRELLQNYNKQSIDDGKSKIKNVISISKGLTLEANIGAEQKLDRTYIGPAVNVCSRLETIAKLYDLEIIVTKEIFDDIGASFKHCRFIDSVKVKGYNIQLDVFEIYAHNPQVVINYKNSINEKLQQGINYYFNKDLKKASAIFKKLLENIPPHTQHPKKVMDGIVHYYASRCFNMLGSRKVVKQLQHVEDGYHDYIDFISYSLYDISKDDIVGKL